VTGVAVIAKAFDVLEAMSALGRAVTLKELSGEIELPKPTLHRLLQTLTELGYVEQDHARSRYNLSLKLFRLGRDDRFRELREWALPAMETLHRRFNERVNLGVLQGSYVAYVHFIETTQNLRWQVHPGARDPFYCTALGRAIVAFLPDARREQLVSQAVLEPRTSRTVADRGALRAALERTARRGWALDEEENDLGVLCFGVPLLERGAPVASLSVSVPASRASRRLQRDIVDALLAIRIAESDTAGSMSPA
jgi:DNA-binding IclR family transcriptional regulator